MKFLLAAVIAALEGLALALLSGLVLAVLGVVFWLTQMGLTTEWGGLPQALAGIWMLGHAVPLTFTLPAEAALGLGLPPLQVGFLVSLPVTGILLLTAVRGIIGGWRAAAVAVDDSADADVTGAINATNTVNITEKINATDVINATSRFNRTGAYDTAAIGSASAVPAGVAAALIAIHAVFVVAGFAAAAFAVSLLARPVLAVPPLQAVLIPAGFVAICYAVGIVARLVASESAWDRIDTAIFEKLAPKMTWLSELLRAALFLSVRIALGLLALSALATALTLILHFVDQLRIMQSLQLDLPGVLAIGIGTLLYLPTLLLWALSWLSGAGFLLGEGQLVSPFAPMTGAVPTVPVFAAMPHDWGAAGALAPVLVLLVTLVIASFSVRAAGIWERVSYPQIALAGVIVALVIGAVAAGLLWFARGSIGPGRLAQLGVDPLPAAAVLAGLVFAGVCGGMIARKLDAYWLYPLTGAAEDLAQERQQRRESRWAVLGGSLGGALGLSEDSGTDRARGARDADDDADPYAETDALHTAALETEAQETAALRAVAETEQALRPVIPLRPVADNDAHPPAQTSDPGSDADPELLDEETILAAYEWKPKQK